MRRLTCSTNYSLRDVDGCSTSDPCILSIVYIDASSLPCGAYFSAVISTLLTFVKNFRIAHEENLEQAELEKKNAEKDTQAEKTKSAQFEKTEEGKL